MSQALDERRRHSEKRLNELRSRLVSAESLAADKACVYVTGSFGRVEASPHSDLDLFIVGRSESHDNSRVLSNLDEICLKAELIRVVRDLQFPEFSGDGEYLKHYTINELVKSLGTPEDDASNAFTARLLLLLESHALIGAKVYANIIDDVIAAYWRDYTKHKDDFLPAFLTNDILRLWRTFCVNYEARTQQDPEDKRRKRRLKNYKLRHSRVLTCYSALLYLMWIWRRNGTVRPEDARDLVTLTPTQRIETVAAHADQAALREALSAIMKQYSTFLDRTNASERELLESVGDNSQWHELSKSAPIFAESIYHAMNAIGAGSQFHRMLVV